MRHPAIGLLWHSWRLSRRWYLLILAIALAATLTIMNLSPRGMLPQPVYREHLAPGTVVFSSILALFTTLVAISLGGRAGFPMRFEFRLPVSTALLVGIPMLALGALCASLYVIPMLTIRLVYGLPMPLLAGAMLVFIPAIGEFVIPSLLGGPGTQMIGRILWDEFFGKTNWPRAAALAITMLVIVVIPFMLMQRAQNAVVDRG